MFQQGYPIYDSLSRPSGPGPVRVQVPWNDFDQRRDKGPYMVTYHVDQKGQDMLRNVSLAKRVLRTEALVAGPERFKEFESLFYESFYHCREALEKQKKRCPEKFSVNHLRYGLSVIVSKT